MLDRKQIKKELLKRGMTLAMWAKAHEIEYSSLSRVLADAGGPEITRKIRAALDSDELLFEMPEILPEMTAQAVFWTFPIASMYLGISEPKLRLWERKGIANFPRAIRIGSNLLLSSKAVKQWGTDVLEQHGFL